MAQFVQLDVSCAPVNNLPFTTPSTCSPLPLASRRGCRPYPLGRTPPEPSARCSTTETTTAPDVIHMHQHPAPSSRPWAGIRTRRRKPRVAPPKTYPRPLGRPHNPSQSRTHGRRTSWVRWCGKTSGWQERYPSAGAIVPDPQRGQSRPRGTGDVDGSPHGSDILA
jgi:hypothetical protein